MRPIHLLRILLGVYEPWQASWPITNRRAIHRAATSDANTFTHHASTNSKLAIDTPSTSQSSRNQMIGAATPRSIVNGCSNFCSLKRDLSGEDAASVSDSDSF